MIKSSQPTAPVMMEEMVSDPAEAVVHAARRERFLRNMSWFEDHLNEIREQHVGKYVCVAAEKVFVAATPREAVARAHVALPEESGAGYVTFISPSTSAKIYAVRR